MDGGCFCGAVRYRIDADPPRITHCHCRHCRRASGAPFVTWLALDKSAFSIVSGRPQRYESRPGVVRQFCGSCGTQLTYELSDAPATIDVTAGSLDEPDSLTPDYHIWCERMLPWVEIADGLPRHARWRRKG